MAETNDLKQVNYLPPNNVTVNYSNIEGIGVFATKNIKAGDVVERCPMVSLAWRNNYIQDPVIWQYLYSQPKCDCYDCKNHGAVMWMVLGYGMLYNHQDIPNTTWSFHYDQKYADIIATTDIVAGEEIFVSYGSTYFNNRKKIEAVKKDNMIDSTDLDDDDAFMEKINQMLNNPQQSNTPQLEPSIDLEEDDESFMSRMNDMMKQVTDKIQEQEIPQSIEEQIRLYGSPIR